MICVLFIGVYIHIFVCVCFIVVSQPLSAVFRGPAQEYRPLPKLSANISCQRCASLLQPDGPSSGCL